MKILKSFALVASMAIITASVSAQAPAQGKMDPQQMAQNQTNRIKQNVSGITPDQEKQLLAVNQMFVQGMQDARSNSNGDRDAMRAKMQPLKDARDTKIKGILTADQYTQFQKMESEHMGGGHRGGN